MTRFVVVAACVSLLAGAPVLAADRFVIYVNGKLKASDDQTSRALQRSVDRFRGKTTQIDFLEKDEKSAAFAYLLFTVDKGEPGDPSMFMTSDVRIARAASRPIESDCVNCGSQPVRRLFHDVIEQTLFDGERALYKPLKVLECDAPGVKAVTIRIAKAANGIGLEHGIHYGLRVATAAEETGVILVRDAKATDDVTSTFAVTGPATPQANLITACRTNTATKYVLVPHARLPGDGAKVNDDADSSTD